MHVLEISDVLLNVLEVFCASFFFLFGKDVLFSVCTATNIWRKVNHAIEYFLTLTKCKTYTLPDSKEKEFGGTG